MQKIYIMHNRKGYFAALTNGRGETRWTTARYPLKATAVRLARALANGLGVPVVDGTR